MFKNLLFIIVFSFWSVGNILQAQQWHSYNPTAWFDVNAIEIPGPGTIVIGGGREALDSIQIMFRGDNYGLSWTENSHDGLAPWNKSIAFSDSIHGYGAGYDGRIIYSDDGGYNWGYPIYPVNRDFNKIIHVDPNTYFIAGGNKTHDSVQTILKSTDNGSNWNIIYDRPGPWLKSVYFFDTIKGYAVGDNGVILATTNGGGSWATVSAPVIRDFNSITFINPDTGYIVGGSPSGLCTILRTVNGGTSWVVIRDVTGGTLNDISFADADRGYIAGDSATVLKTTDGGLNWLPLTIDPGLSGTETFMAVKFYNTGFGVIGGKAGKLYVYGDPLLTEVQTRDAYLVTSTQVEFHANINTRYRQANYSFHYSTDSTFSSSLITSPQSVTSNSLKPVSWVENSLLPNTKYYYFAAAELTGVEHVYGDTLSFTTHLPFSTFETQNATLLPGDSAVLRGTAHHVSVPMDLFFEYGSTNLLGKEARAVPPSVHDTSMHNISVVIDSLQPFSFYYFRLKGVSPQGIYCGYTYSFLNGILYDIFQTLDATNVSQTAATLNAVIDHFRVPVTFDFEYTDDLWHNIITVAASPPSVNDTLQHTLSTSVSSLQPNTFYNYRLKATTSRGIFYSNSMSFYTGNLYQSFQTLSPTNITDSSASFNGYVHGLNVPAFISFDYGNTPAMGLSAPAYPNSISDTAAYTISGNIMGLTPATQYYCRISANVSGTVFYGNIISFTTTVPGYNIAALPCTNVTSTSAQLNGKINHYNFPVQISFEYDTSLILGNTIAAVPGNINDTLEHFVSAPVTGLLPNTFYYYRVKAVNGTMKYYSNTRKLYTAECIVPNCSFENWNSIPVDLPAEWHTIIGISRKVPSYNGTSALEIKEALAVSGNMDKNDIFGGFPFAARPDSLVFHSKYDVVTGDTAWVMAAFKLNGVFIKQFMAPVTGSSAGDFKRMSYYIPFPDSRVPDTLILVALSTNAFNSQMNPLSILTIDDISFKGPGSEINIPNSDFENWNSLTIEQPQLWIPTDLMFLGGNTSANMVRKTTDRVSGDYALILENDIALTNKQASVTSVNNSRSGYSKPVFRVGGRHSTLNFYAKYQPENKDTLSVALILFSNGVPVGNSYFQIDTAILNYNPFSIDIRYFPGTAIPDSANLSICLGTQDARGNSKAWIDNISLDGFGYVGIDEPANPYRVKNAALHIYPNPADDYIFIEYNNQFPEKIEFSIYDLMGKLVFSKTENINLKGKVVKQINTHNYHPGIYFIKVTSRTLTTSGKFIIQ